MHSVPSYATFQMSLSSVQQQQQHCEADETNWTPRQADMISSPSTTTASDFSWNHVPSLPSGSSANSQSRFLTLDDFPLLPHGDNDCNGYNSKLFLPSFDDEDDAVMRSMPVDASSSSSVLLPFLPSLPSSQSSTNHNNVRLAPRLDAMPPY